jgi:glycosyltransferase involved in cell wall biosynthesis
MDAGDRFAPLKLRLGRMRWSLSPHAPRPLISIVIATWNRAGLLAGRTLPSVLKQTYTNWEAVVVGDACTDDTAQRLEALGDARIRFHNLRERGAYPEDPMQRWMVAGSAPMNRALELARGEWLAYLDDDDLLMENHLESLLGFAGENDAEFVFGAGDFQRSPTEWLHIGRMPPLPGNVMHSSILYRAYLRFLKYDLEAWKDAIGADAHLWGRMHRLGVRFAFLDRTVCQAPLRPGEDLAGQKAAERRQSQSRTTGGAGGESLRTGAS